MSFFRAHKCKINAAINMSPRFRATNEPAKILSHDEPILSQPELAQYWLIVAHRGSSIFPILIAPFFREAHYVGYCWLIVDPWMAQCWLNIGSILAALMVGSLLGYGWGNVGPFIEFIADRPRPKGSQGNL